MRRFGIAALVLALGVTASGEDASDCTRHWESFSSRPYEEIAFPDMGATYWRYRFELPAGRDLAFRIRGLFPYARYMNFNAYDQATLDSSDSLPDRSIQPDEGSSNPFLHGAPRGAPNRSYTVYVVAHGASGTGSSDENLLRLPASGAGGGQRVEIWYRVYLPDAAIDANGGVPLPSLQAFERTTGKPVPCPKSVRSPPSLLLAAKNIPPKPGGGKLYAYRSGARSLYANGDNQYVAMRLPLSPSEVSVIRFRPPSFPETAEGGDTFRGDTDVRYWSLCQGGGMTKTSGCIADTKATVDRDGLVTLVIGPASLAAEMEQRGINFLPRGKFLMPFFIYRNLLTRDGFDGHMARVPSWPPPEGAGGSAAVEAYAAHRFLGDYAPQGRHCARGRFLSGLRGHGTYCGLAVPR